MKTSNKLFIGLLAGIVLCLIIVNLVLNRQVKQKSVVKPNTTQIDTMATDSAANVSDSIAMETAIGNE